MENHNGQGQGLLEDLLTPITNTWTTFCNQDSTFLPSICDNNNFNEEDDSFLASNSSFLQLISSTLQPTFPNLDVSIYSSYDQQQVYGYEHDDKPMSMVGLPTMLEQQDDKNHEEHDQVVVVSDNQIQDNVFRSGEKESKSKKVDGQPSKNLMAERRRRKRLNDRLSMLRSIVPRISKMDRTSILGDTIEYMKELQEKIRNLKAQDMELVSNSLNWMVSNKDLKMNEAQARNMAKFEVERRNMDTRIQISCSTKPGLLLSTMNTIEALGLEIQQCVISSFGDFTLQASCSEALENRVTMSSDEIKHILFRNAGYGGKGL